MNFSEVTNSQQAGELSEEMQRNLLLSYLIAHKMTYIQDFLKERQLPYSYRKNELPNKISEYLDSGKVALPDLIELLNSIEGWGKQHIYLYRALPEMSARWLSPGFIEHHLLQHGEGFLDLLNRSRPLILPNEPTLSTIEFKQGRVRFVWVERRVWHVRIRGADNMRPLQDSEPISGLFPGQIVWQAYQVKMARGLIVFEWNLNTNDAMLLIQQLPSEKNYKAVRDEFENRLQSLLDIQLFQKVRVSSGISGIETCGETRRHHMTFRSLYNRTKVTFTSPQREQDVFDDDIVTKRARTEIRDDAAGLIGNFYWLPKQPRPSAEIYTQIYGEDDDDQRIGILAEHAEEDVRYVLSRIRSHCV